MDPLTTHLSRRAALRVAMTTAAAGALGTAAAGDAHAVLDLGIDAPWHARARTAGFAHRRVTVGDVTFSYREGPDNGPALVLLHAQHMDWFSYSRVLPALAASYHVFDIDYQGHGATTTHADYPMTADRVGADLAELLVRVVGRPAFVTGNSSGGLLAAWLAANRPHLVRGVVLEDPPLFSSEFPRIQRTIAYRSFMSSAKAVAEDVDDFLLFWINDNREFFTTNIAPGSAAVLTAAVIAQRALEPGRPVELDLVADDMVRLMLRGMDRQYDPRFGEAFADGSWGAGFDHATTLRRIQAPTLLLHANFHFVEDGVLFGAMDDEDAARAMACLPGGTYLRMDAEHVTHLSTPEEFVRLVRDFC